MRRSRFLMGLAMFTAVVTGTGGGATAVRGCSLDNKPSVYADGQLAGINPTVPLTSAQLATWAFFAFPRTFRARTAVILTENRREVAQTLIPAAMRRPWRWRFGDGQSAFGWTVRHRYARAGSWRIGVDAFDPGTKKWYNFDQVLIRISR